MIEVVGVKFVSLNGKVPCLSGGKKKRCCERTSTLDEFGGAQLSCHSCTGPYSTFQDALEGSREDRRRGMRAADLYFYCGDEPSATRRGEIALA